MVQNPCNSNLEKPKVNNQDVDQQVNQQFTDLHQPLNPQQALEESDRCLYCYDAPCIQACPTSIDIPTFIHQIRSDNAIGAAKTILSENIMGGTCARVCPTEVLCEQVCVLNVSHQQPIEIGLLQRHAVDQLLTTASQHPFKRAKSNGKTIAIIGAGPAGLSCSHRLSMLGYEVVIYEAKEKAGGLNEYGLAEYKMVDNFAQREVDFIKNLGGITLKNNQKLGVSVSLKSLQEKYHAVFIGVGLGNTYSLELENEEVQGVLDAVDFIEQIRQTADKARVQVGNDVVVIGAGNTAIDAAVQAKKLGAKNVTLVYRRDEEHMSATSYEIELARKNGIIIKTRLAPGKIIADKYITQIQCSKTELVNGKLSETLFRETIKCDMLLKAIGQKLNSSFLSNINIEKGKIVIDKNYQTNIQGIYAGGDAIKSGEDLTVQAVEDGKQAAIAMDRQLTGEL
ncbi:MAG: NAD(P)-dependent oxidoreductase [Proteobacteria bacterium]|nr:NAD(P)-dependent oxidoreductase [Pseudomonadota bacterium]